MKEWQDGQIFLTIKVIEHRNRILKKVWVFSEGTQYPSEHNPVQCAAKTLLEQGDWIKWHPEVPSNFNYSVYEFMYDCVNQSPISKDNCKTNLWSKLKTNVDTFINSDLFLWGMLGCFWSKVHLWFWEGYKEKFSKWSVQGSTGICLVPRYTQMCPLWHGLVYQVRCNLKNNIFFKYVQIWFSVKQIKSQLVQ